MLLSKTAMVKWNGYTRKHYEERGYKWTKQNELFECQIEDVMSTSTVRVEAKCDYCEDGVAYKEYRSYLKEREIIPKDCCKNRKCMVTKSEEVNLIKYGVTTYAKTDESKNNARRLFQTPLDEVEKYINSKGLRVLNIQDYENDRTRLFVICNTHEDKGIQETNFANIKSNKHCCKYIKHQPSKRRLDGNIIVKSFIDAGLIPLFNADDYKSNSQPLPYQCPNHLDKGIQYRSYGNLPYCNGCEYCSRERTKDALRNNEEDVFDYFLSKGLIVLENQKYLNKDQTLFYRCKDHLGYIQSSTYGNLQKATVPCEYCRNENSISSLNRRLRNSIGKWRESSVNNCNSECILTGDKVFEVHHLYSFNSIIKDALQELNISIKDEYNGEEIFLIKNRVIKLHNNLLGVCIRPDLHILFHQQYGKHDNTPEQFEEFKINYLNNKLEIKDGEVI